MAERQETVDHERVDETTEPHRINLGRWLEVAAVVLMSLAALLTAWSGYQSSRWSGVQSTDYSAASARRVDSTRSASLANQRMAIDVLLFGNYLNAYATGNQELATFYEQ